MDNRLLNGGKKVTIIEKWDHTVLLLGPRPIDRMVFNNLDDAKMFIAKKDYEISVHHLHRARRET